MTLGGILPNAQSFPRVGENLGILNIVVLVVIPYNNVRILKREGETDMNKDLTTGKPASVLLRFTLPMLLSVAFQQLYNIADSVIAGKFAGDDDLHGGRVRHEHRYFGRHLAAFRREGF